MKSMHTTGQKGPDRLDEQLLQTGGDRCPTCGEPIAAIVARAPGVYEIRPCGHDTGALTTRDVARSTVRESAARDNKRPLTLVSRDEEIDDLHKGGSA